MSLAILLPALACAALLIYFVVQRAAGGGDDSGKRLALLVGAQRAWGESDASLRRRSVALSRWPFKEDAPELAWWARLWARIWRRR